MHFDLIKSIESGYVAIGIFYQHFCNTVVHAGFCKQLTRYLREMRANTGIEIAGST